MTNYDDLIARLDRGCAGFRLSEITICDAANAIRELSREMRYTATALDKTQRRAEKAEAALKVMRMQNQNPARKKKP